MNNGLTIIVVLALITALILLLDRWGGWLISSLVKHQPRAQWDETHMRDRLTQALEPGTKWYQETPDQTLDAFDKHVEEAMTLAGQGLGPQAGKRRTMKRWSE